MKTFSLNLILCITTAIGVGATIITTIQNHNQKSKLNEFNKFVESLVSQDSEISIVISKKESGVINKEEQEYTWTLQIITFSDVIKNINRASNIAKILKKATGCNTFVAKRGEELVICVGRFNSKDSDEMKNTLDKITKLEYEGKLRFAASYPIQVR
jgi:hypothetical protein